MDLVVLAAVEGIHDGLITRSLPAFVLGLMGGALVELAGFYRLRRLTRAQFPAHLRSIVYWTITTIMIASGAALAVIYVLSDIKVSPLAAVNIGASAPFIIERLAGNASPFNPTVDP